MLNFLNVLLPLVIALLLLVRPQLFTKRDLQAEENKGVANMLKTIGWVFVVVALLMFIGDVLALLVK